MMKKLMFILMISVPAFMVNAADKINLSVDDAVKMALENNDSVRIEKEKVRAAQDEVRATISGFLPKFSASLDWTRYYEKPIMKMDLSSLGDLFPVIPIPGYTPPYIGEVEFEATKEYETALGFTITQPLFLGGKIPLAILSAGTAESAQQKIYEAAVNEVTYYTKVSYYNVLYSEEIYKISKSAYYKAIKNRNALKSRTSSGRLSRMDNIRMEADIAAKKPKMLEGKMNYELAVRRFKQITGIDQQDEVEFTDQFKEKFPDYNVEEEKKKMHRNNPRLKTAETVVKLYEGFLNLERTEYLPDLAAFASARYSGGSSDVFIGKENIDRTVLFGLKASFDIFTSGNRLFKNGKAEHDLEAKKIEYEKTVKELDYELEEALHRYSLMRATYAELKTSVSLVKESYNTMYEMFESGRVNMNDLNNAEDRYDDTVKSRIKAVFGLNSIIAEIDKLTKGGEKTNE